MTAADNCLIQLLNTWQAMNMDQNSKEDNQKGVKLITFDLDCDIEDHTLVLLTLTILCQSPYLGCLCT